jgi:dihydroorotate dehydrogenase
MNELSKISIMARPVEVMGLRFSNALGLAAGIDRSGEHLATLAISGVGHAEVGTIKDAQAIRFDCRDIENLIVGVNIASPRPFIDDVVLDDYARLMESVWHRAHYIVAGLGQPSLGRTGDMPGIERLIEKIAQTRDDLIRRTRRRVPVLVKTRGGTNGAVPRAVPAARRSDLDGVLLVTPSLESLCDCRRELGPRGTVVSVGGIAGVRDAEARLSSGASLVQIYTVFVAHGAAGIRACLDPTKAAKGTACRLW